MISPTIEEFYFLNTKITLYFIMVITFFLYTILHLTKINSTEPIAAMDKEKTGDIKYVIAIGPSGGQFREKSCE